MVLIRFHQRWWYRWRIHLRQQVSLSTRRPQLLLDTTKPIICRSTWWNVFYMCAWMIDLLTRTSNTSTRVLERFRWRTQAQTLTVHSWALAAKDRTSPSPGFFRISRSWLTISWN
jgi:hypothetical protein